MTDTHTKEPWTAHSKCPGQCCWHIKGINDEILDWDINIPEMSEADAKRIVACVNACVGCATAILEVTPTGFFNSTYGHPTYLKKLEQQRDELLTALRVASKSLSDDVHINTKSKVLAAIAKVEVAL